MSRGEKRNNNMYFPLLILFLVLGWIGWSLLGKSPLIGKGLMGASLVACLGLLGWQILSAFGVGSTPRLHRSQAAVGYTLAHQFLRDTSERKGEVVLLFPPEKAAPSAALDSFYEAFARVMTRFPNVSVRESVVGNSVSAAKRGEIALEDFSAALSATNQVLAYVSWVGFPEGADTLDLLQDPDSRAPMYVYDPLGKTNWFSSVLSGIVAAGVVEVPSGEASPRNEKGPRTPEVLFAENYRMITPQNLKGH